MTIIAVQLEPVKITWMDATITDSVKLLELFSQCSPSRLLDCFITHEKVQAMLDDAIVQDIWTEFIVAAMQLPFEMRLAF